MASDYQNILQDIKMICGTSRKGDYWDNAPMEFVLCDFVGGTDLLGAIGDKRRGPNENI